MQARLRRLARIRDAQGQMYRLAEVELARVAGQALEAEAQRQHLVQALDARSPFHGLFPVTTAHRLKALAVEESRLRAESDARSAALLASAIQRKRTERLVDRLRAEHGAALEKRAWLHRLEAFAASAASGSRADASRADASRVQASRAASLPSASNARASCELPSTAPMRTAPRGRRDSEVP